MERNIKSWDELPLTLTVSEVGSILGISRGKAYSLVREETFPSLLIGKRLCVPKQLFIDWVNANTKRKRDENDG